MCSNKQFDPNFVLVRNFGKVQLLMTKEGKFYLFYLLTPEQQKLLGKKISFLTCWRKHDLCKQHLKRIHLTCLTCKLRRVITLKDPYFYEISIHQIWIKKSTSSWRLKLIKKLLSIVEALTY
jgi:hypothetical protein